MKKNYRIFLALILVFSMVLITSCSSQGSSRKEDSFDSKNDERSINEVVTALQAFAEKIGEGDPNRQMDADITVTDRLDASGRYSVRISSYHLKNVYNEGSQGGLLIDGVFQIQSDIEELNSISEMVIYMGADGSNFAVVNGEKTEPHSDFLFFVAVTRIPEKVAQIDSEFIKSVSKNTVDGITEYSLVINGEGLYNSPDLFNLFVISAFQEESERFEISDVEYVFSVDEDNNPKTSFIRVAINPIDPHGEVSYISADVSIVFNAFENVVIEEPEYKTD